MGSVNLFQRGWFWGRVLRDYYYYYYYYFVFIRFLLLSYPTLYFHMFYNWGVPPPSRGTSSSLLWTFSRSFRSFLVHTRMLAKLSFCSISCTVPNTSHILTQTASKLSIHGHENGPLFSVELKLGKKPKSSIKPANILVWTKNNRKEREKDQRRLLHLHPVQNL